MLDRVVYYIALVTLMAVPATLVAWLLLHMLVSFWRRIGSVTSLMTIVAVTILVMWSMYLVRDPLLEVKFGVRWPLVSVGVVLLALSCYLNVQVYRQVPKRMALGLDEVSSDDFGELVTNGIYSRSRHPRFLGMALAVAAVAFLTNFAALYVLVPVYLVGITLVAILEERELVARFGSQYLEYARDVPRFVPRFRAHG